MCLALFHVDEVSWPIIINHVDKVQLSMLDASQEASLPQSAM